MLRSTVVLCAFLLSDATSIAAQSSRFEPALLERPDVRAAMQSVDTRAGAIVDEWIKIVEIPAPSGKEQARTEYIRAEMQRVGLTDIRTDDIHNVSGVKGDGGRADRRLCGTHGHRLPRRDVGAGDARGEYPARAGRRRRHGEPDGHLRDVSGARASQGSDGG